nr:protein TRAUCO-like [Aedes albopictus]
MGLMAMVGAPVLGGMAIAGAVKKVFEKKESEKSSSATVVDPSGAVIETSTQQINSTTIQVITKTFEGIPSDGDDSTKSEVKISVVDPAGTEIKVEKVEEPTQQLPIIDQQFSKEIVSIVEEPVSHVEISEVVTDPTAETEITEVVTTIITEVKVESVDTEIVEEVSEPLEGTTDGAIPIPSEGSIAAPLATSTAVVPKDETSGSSKQPVETSIKVSLIAEEGVHQTELDDKRAPTEQLSDKDDSDKAKSVEDSSVKFEEQTESAKNVTETIQKPLGNDSVDQMPTNP